MLYWIYDVPPLWTVGLFAALFVGVCWLGVVLFRPFVRERLNSDARLNETLGDFLQYFGVMYGLLLGLLAVATYQNHTDVEKAVSSEAASLAALYRDVTAYPEPPRAELKTLLREYTRYVIEEAWPLQRQGLVPPGGVKRIADFQASLVSFEPQTKAQEALHDAAMRQFNSFFEYRRARVYSVNSGIPPLLWYTVGVGALINMIFIWLFDLRLRVHLLLGGIISFFLATMISLIALMDHPFRGEVGVSSDAFQLIYDQLMKE
ncbi:MAG: hypothetical protein ABW318_07655 [Vicinamibacterales bacterium]